MRPSLVFAFTLFLILRPPIFAEDGHLDLTFGKAGRVTTDFSGNWDSAAALAIQPDGKIVAAGWSVTRSGLRAEKTDAVLSRYNEDGGLDLSFGTEGRVSVSFPDQLTFANNSFFGALAIQPDGKIVGLGASGSGFLVRLNNSGTLDTSFGNGGIVTGLSYPFALAIQPDGKMIVALAGLALGSLARYNIDGTMDTTFGDQGTVDFLNGSGQGVRSRVLALTIQSDGKIVTGGEIIYNTTPQVCTEQVCIYGRRNFAVARYNSNGQPDKSFGTDGIVRTDTFAGGYPETNESVAAVAVQSDGKIVAAGGYGFVTTTSTETAVGGVVLVRYSSNGTLDTAFGEGGRVMTAGAAIGALAIQADGKLIVAGAFPLGLRFGLARYGSDGSLDVTFGMGGIVSTDFTDLGFFDCWGASAVAIQADGKIVAAGMSNFGWLCAPDFALARYNNDGPVTNISPINLTFIPERVNPQSSFTATFLGMVITNETFFDLRFRNPIDEMDHIALNWQKGIGILTSHDVPIGTVPGSWAITGVRPHRMIDDHTGDFVPVSATLNVVAR